MDAGLTFRLRRRTVAVLLLIAAALAMAISRPDKPGELAVYMKAADRILHGEQIYRTDDTAAFTYPPFFVLPTVPLAPLPPYVRARVWWFVNFCLAGVILFLIARLVWPIVARGTENDRRLRWVLALAVAVLAGRFLTSPLEYKSHDLIVLALVVLAGYAMAQRDGWAGVCIGLATACKATPLSVSAFVVLAKTVSCDGLFFGCAGRGHATTRRALSVSGRASLGRRLVRQVHIQSPSRRPSASCWRLVKLEHAQPRTCGDDLSAFNAHRVAGRHDQRVPFSVARREPATADSCARTSRIRLAGVVYVAQANACSRFRVRAHRVDPGGHGGLCHASAFADEQLAAFRRAGSAYHGIRDLLVVLPPRSDHCGRTSAGLRVRHVGSGISSANTRFGRRRSVARLGSPRPCSWHVDECFARWKSRDGTVSMPG